MMRDLGEINRPLTAALPPELLCEEEASPWGELTPAMNIALDFWEARFGPGYDHYTTYDNTPILEELLKQHLPQGCDADTPKFVAHVTALLTVPELKSGTTTALNYAILHLPIDGETMVLEQLKEMQCGYVKLGQSAIDIVKLARITMAEAAEDAKFDTTWIE
jgi:hypothetical protein